MAHQLVPIIEQVAAPAIAAVATPAATQSGISTVKVFAILFALGLLCLLVIYLYTEHQRRLAELKLTETE